MPRATFGIALPLCCVAWSAAWGERLYEQGPLRASEFLAKPPANKPYKAVTSTKLNYQYRYQSAFRPGRATAKLTELELTSEFEPQQSWNRRPDDPQLLRHEQGHFDITEAVRVRAAAFWKSRIGVLRVTGATEKAAIAKLDSVVKREMRPFFERIQVLHREYDRVTMHGQQQDKQRKWRAMLAAAAKDAKPPLPVVER